MSENNRRNKIVFKVPFEIADCPVLQDAVADYNLTERRDPTNGEREEILVGILHILSTTRELIQLMPDATEEELVYTLNAELNAREQTV